MTKPKTRSDLDARLMDVEEIMAGGMPERELRPYRLEAGRLRKAIRRRDTVLKQIEQGKRRFFGSERDIALAEAEDMSTAGGLKPHERGLWAGVAFAIMQESF